MIRLAALCLVGFACIQAATIPPPASTTHRPHGHHTHAHRNGTRPTKEPSEHENFKFAYEPNSHHMVLANGNNCYIVLLSDAERTAVHTDTGIRALEHHMVLANGNNCYIVLLSDAEKTAVHTDTGIRALELKLLGLISSGTLTTVSKDTLDKRTLHWCGRVQGSYYDLS